MTPEERLHGLLTDDRHAVAAWADPVGRVARGIDRRQHRRRVGVAAALAVVALVVAAVPATVRWSATPPTTPGAPLRTVDAVPWRPAPRPALPPAPLRPRLPVARACEADDLETPEYTGDKHSRGRYSLVLFNVADTRCTMRQSTAIVATDPRTGRRVELPTEPAIVDTVGDPPPTIEPRERAEIDLVLTDDCDAPPNPAYVSPALYTAGREFPIRKFVFHTGCLVRLGAWRVRQPDLPAPYLEVRIGVPNTVQRGRPLVYYVLLRNAGPAPIPLDPCPVFYQRLTGNERPAEHHEFNCPGREIPPYGRLRFEMRIDVPADMAPGYQYLIWRAVAPGRGVFAPQPGTWDVVLITE
jgi:hypothetical protein